MIVIESKRKKVETISTKYPNSKIIDVTSKGEGVWVKFSPFYPHYGIPVPFSDGVKAACVEGIWQGLKVFEHEGVDYGSFRNDTMKDIKRTVRTHGRCMGHQKGCFSKELLDYISARKLIYVPSYNWVLEHKLGDYVEMLRNMSKEKRVVLLDYETNADVEDGSKPLSHASLIKAWIESHNQ